MDLERLHLEKATDNIDMKFLLILINILLWLNLGFSQDSSSPINHSYIAFSIPEKDLLPENIAFDQLTGSFFIGSTRKGKIIRIDEEGHQSTFISSKQDGLWMIIGMKTDAKNRWLWVCSSGGDNLIDYKLKDDKEGRPAGIFKFDLDSGKLIKKYVKDDTGSIHFFNDLVLDKDGNAYITHMFEEHAIYKIDKSSDRLELFLKPDELKYPNGIAISDDGKLLFVAHSDGIGRIDIATKSYVALGHPEELKISRRESIDGLYFHQNTLIGIQADIKTVQQFVLSEDFSHIKESHLLEVDHPMMNNPTTGVMVKDELFYLANAQFGSFDKEGELFPMTRLYEPLILKIKITE